MNIIPDAVVDDGDVVGEIERGGGDEERNEDKEDQICAQVFDRLVWKTSSPFARHVGVERTEDELLGGSEHVQGEGDFILVLLQLQPADKGRQVRDLRLLLDDLGVVGHFQGNGPHRVRVLARGYTRTGCECVGWRLGISINRVSVCLESGGG